MSKSKKNTKTGKKNVAKDAVKKTEKKLSITKALHQLFDKVGAENVKLAEALAIAKKIKPSTAFNSKHLTWHRHYYRELIARRAEIKAAQ